MNYELYTLWAASIYTSMVVIKALAKANKIHESAFYVRALPLLPAVIGSLSGLLVGPEVFGWSPLHGAFFGIGAAGVAATAHAVHRQTIKGCDDRLYPDPKAAGGNEINNLRESGRGENPTPASKPEPLVAVVIDRYGRSKPLKKEVPDE